jgi:hypothetical protein
MEKMYEANLAVTELFVAEMVARTGAGAEAEAVKVEDFRYHSDSTEAIMEDNPWIATAGVLAKTYGG